MSIGYLPMLVEAAAGGLLVATGVSAVAMRLSGRPRGLSPMHRALMLSGIALVLVTLVVEVPSKLGSGVADPTHWLLVATVFNVIRLWALGVAIGLVLGRDGPRSRPEVQRRAEGELP
ncbi:hypothetical protein [Nocardioides sp.]|uniref:hypothetical protein n=1 Tax=Nocardioides sp. TaxID=35761 RepID=UPI003527D376